MTELDTKLNPPPFKSFDRKKFIRECAKQIIAVTSGVDDVEKRIELISEVMEGAMDFVGS